jgi:hypothetical protein
VYPDVLVKSGKEISRPILSFSIASSIVCLLVVHLSLQTVHAPSQNRIKLVRLNSGTTVRFISGDLYQSMGLNPKEIELIRWHESNHIFLR